MALPETQDETSRPTAQVRRQPRPWRSLLGFGSGALMLAVGSAAWLERERIAADIIDDYLTDSGVSATYDVIAIGPRTQIIENLVIGDPAQPDFTARRVVVELGVGWAGPEVQRVAIDGARLFASYRDGTFSLGSLDPLVFSGSAEPPALPAIDVALTDARALLESDYGAVGIKLDGAGRLDQGFKGELAATAPRIGMRGCRADTATLLGKITTTAGAPQLEGPLRLSGLDCGGARLARADIGTDLVLTRDFARAEVQAVIEGAGAAYAAYTGTDLRGTARVTWSDTGLVLAHDLAFGDVTLPEARLARLSAEGTWRSTAGVSDPASRGAWQGQIEGEGLAADPALGDALAEAEQGLAGTLLAPLLAKARVELGKALDGARLRAEALVRHKPGEVTLIIPEAALSNRSGERVAALSQVNLGLVDGRPLGLRGNVLVGGAGLPRINGRMEQAAGGVWALRLAMAEYGAGANRLAIPRLTVREERGGALRFEGIATASGALPGGAIDGLALPLEGRWSPRGGLAFGTGCMPIRFRALAVSGLELAGQAITLCPDDGAPLLVYDDSLRLAARSGPLALNGRLGDSPASLAATSLALRYPEPFAAEGLSARIGPPGSEIRLAAARLTGSLADTIGGSFAGASARLDLAPFAMDRMGGEWTFADGILRVVEGAFTLADRPPEGPARFVPLASHGAGLTLADNLLRARARLSHPASERVVADIAIDHDPAAGQGGARLEMPGLVFDETLQPEDLSYLAEDLIVLANGTVTGEGRIDWQGGNITSSGSIASKGFDFAAPFGPVRGLKGQVVFSDLVNLTTAPDQTVTIDAINPGVEVLAGTVRFDLSDGTLLNLRDARFPFMGGELVLRPLAMDFSKPEERRYVFDIKGLDAARFVAQMELTNIGATGIFDGTVPIVFDADGNGRIERGVLASRAGGGNVAYIGELTYEDLGAMGNYVFSALRSLDYRQMRVGLNGSLGGEIITNFDFDGVRQGEGTSRNFITRKIAKLPIRFKVNVRSENFFELSTMVRSFWDIEYLGSPVDRGLLKVENGRFVPARILPNPVQPSESESQP